MEETLRIIFSVIISIGILFIFPLYITFEQRDNVAYSMAMKITSNFVENVRNKGYITSKMYSDFLSNLSATGNTYDINLEHRANKVYPYKYIENGKEINSYKFVEELYTEKQILPIINKEIDPDKNVFLNVFWDKKKEDYINTILTNEYNHGYIYMYSISDVLQYGENVKLPIYAMNVGDVFNVIVKNNNISLATMVFKLFSGTKYENDNVRVYVNYGGTILNEEYES